MFAALLRHFLLDAGQVWRLRSWCAGAVLMLAAAAIVRAPASPREAVELVTWGLFFIAILLGGSLTGWGVTQFPKTRAAEFLLVTPVEDWEWVGAQLAAGMLRTTVVIAAAVPLVAAMWGAGWIDFVQAAALVLVPLAAGWLAGIGLAVVAYSPLWLRVLLERLALVGVLAYLVLLGLMGSWFLPAFVQWSEESLGVSAGVWFRPDETLRFFNPFRLLGMLGQSSTVDAAMAARVGGVLVLLWGACFVGAWRLVARLRPHYIEENYGSPNLKKEYRQPVGENPLKWWTVRRVSRFRGQVNIYLGAATIGLFTAYMIFQATWPSWLAGNVMLVLEILGGQAGLGAFALQYSLIATSFLPGIWDSTPQLRVGRLELLLVSPATPDQYLEASAAACWTRGRWYLAMASVVWTGAWIAGRIGPGALVALHLVSACYLVAFFAVSFWNFPRLDSERSVALWGLGLSLGIPAFTGLLLWARLTLLAALTPLGAVYLLALPVQAAEAMSGLSWPLLWSWIALGELLWLAAGLILLARGRATFDGAIRHWFASQSVHSRG